MGKFIYFTEAQKERAASVDLESFLRQRGEKLLPSGRDKRLARDHSVTVRGCEWFDHASRQGGRAISFVQRFYDLSYPEAVSLLLDGQQGETMAKVVRTLVMYGEAFGAERMVPVTSRYGHTVISFGIGVMKPVYDLYDQLLQAGAVSRQPFSADPRPLDRNIPSSLLQNIVFKFMYSQQDRYEDQLRKLGLMDDNAYTCACYLPQAGNVPQRGEVLSWAESSAVVYANSVLGARCNRNSGIRPNTVPTPV